MRLPNRIVREVFVFVGRSVSTNAMQQTISAHFSEARRTQAEVFNSLLWRHRFPMVSQLSHMPIEEGHKNIRTADAARDGAMDFLIARMLPDEGEGICPCEQVE